MSTTTIGSVASAAASPAPTLPAPRVTTGSWPATRLPAERAREQLASMPVVRTATGERSKRLRGIGLLLDWLSALPGSTWQDRWLVSGADTAGADWRRVPNEWLGARGHSRWQQEALVEALPVAISADLLRPSLTWLVAGGGARGGGLVRNLAASRDPQGFARLRELCAGDGGVSKPTTTQCVYRCALILAARGGTMQQITVVDVVELFAAEDRSRPAASGGRTTFYRVLRDLGVFGDEAPAMLRGLRTRGQQTPEELIDRYRLVNRPIRDLLVDYLRERQPALDYTSLVSLSYYLGKRFWADIEAHNPSIDSLHLSRQVADDWKRRLRTFTRTKTLPAGERNAVTVERINYRECLTPVRALYLDLAHWAVEDPARWGPWVVPCPVGEEEVNRRKAKRHRKARMDARTRRLLPTLPVLVRAVDLQRTTARSLLAASARTEPGQPFTAGGVTLIRSVVERGARETIWADDPATGKRRNLSREEDRAFWGWAIIEVLRTTGVRVEELLELNHHSLVQYRLPTTGQIVPLLQILPSKTDTERLLVVSPELAEVLSAIISRIRLRSGAVPLVSAYDPRERLWSPPAPVLFQRRIGTESRAISTTSVGKFLSSALSSAGLNSPGDDEPLHYTPHDFRRLFITDAILGGLPPHIAQVIAGHRDINVTLGYKAIYPEETIQAHLAFLARRRSLRPTEEYRAPTDDEWQEFLGHFERRKVSIGTCARAFGSPCIHEHACVRCSMLWPDPDQRPRLIDIRDNLTARISEAEREGWLGEIEGLQVSLAGATEKITQIDQRSGSKPTTVAALGIPTART